MLSLHVSFLLHVLVLCLRAAFSSSLWAIDNFTRAVSLAEISRLLSFNFIQIPIFAFIGFLIVIFRVALYGASTHTIDSPSVGRFYISLRPSLWHC